MPTRRPKVPKAGSTGAGAAGGTAAGRDGTKPVRRRSAEPGPDTISATKSADADAPQPARGDRPAAAKRAAAKPAAAEPKPVKAPAAKPGKPGKPAKPAKAAGAKQRPGTAAEDSDDLRPVPAKAFSGRLLVLAMVTLVVTVLLAPSVNTYLHQRSDIAALEADIAGEKETSRNLEAQLDRWEDPNYIKQQARERIFLVMPGETRYLVKGEHGVENAEQEAQEQAEDLQWVDSLWDSVKRSATGQ